MSVSEPTNPGRPAWFTSSYSNGAGGECVEAAFVPAGVLVRDSKVPGGPHVTVSAEAWHKFLTASAG
ncbi:DUF397 domain-containing protein [Streptomyces sp. NBC_01340]|uniref:DUF397 domain-containing protein n=1 Tax=Streptomyces TaxID=1883 RepID=UPI002250E239|nr:MULTISPECIES: DUF397 domain-containing protein [unclassified Streptomyces]MCX4454375.1 DUF397 domain-containing protein [Streptomyces sp. NBC_01719]MCX4493735.1 DUF397 domain-containing protein [Streptomyces sp. NBC_01728]WSI38834.1 DUF397 domain-containing protein [Streptomyces sp. NBC_01340]